MDEMLVDMLNLNEISANVIHLERLAKGKYKFGIHILLTKVVNGHLVIRVGAGYMDKD